MGIIYIKESIDDYELIRNNEEKLFGCIKRIIAIKRIIKNEIVIKDIDENNKIMIIPRLYENEEIKKNNKLINQIIENIKKCEKDVFKIRKIVLSKKMKKYKELNTILSLNKYEVVQGKEFTKYCLNSIIQYIYKYRKRKMCEDNIAILIDEKDKFILEKIKLLAMHFKTVNVISSNLKQFERFEKDLYHKSGVLINVSNNKRKSLLKMDIIINYNLKNGQIEQYEINKNAIIINLINEKSVNVQRKLMNGIYISGVEIATDKTEEQFEQFNIYNQFEILDIYEALENSKMRIKDTSLLKSPRILNLIGINGELNVSEFR